MTALEEYLESFSGAIIAVSHDRYFLDRICRRIFAVEPDGRVRQYTGGFTDWQDTVKQRAAEGKKAERQPKQEAPRPRQQKLKFTFREQREFETIDEDIALLEEKSAALDEEILANATNSGKLNELMKQKEEVEAQLEAKMERWEYLNELYEKILAAQNDC